VSIFYLYTYLQLTDGWCVCT